MYLRLERDTPRFRLILNPQFSRQSTSETRQDRPDRWLTYPDSVIPSYSTSRKNPNGDAVFWLYARVIAVRAPRCFRVGSRVSLLTLRPALFGPVLPGQASALRVRGGKAICLWDLPAAFYQTGYHASAPEEDGPSYDALYQEELPASQDVAFGLSHRYGSGFSKGRERGSITEATAEAAAASTAVACRFESPLPPRVISIS